MMNEKHLKVTAKTLSYLFNPLVLPTLGLLMLLNSGAYFTYIPWEMKKVIFMIVFMGTCLLPLGFIPFFVMVKYVKSIDLFNRSDRFFPLMVTLIIYYIAFHTMQRLDVPNVMKAFLLSALISVFITSLVTSFWKISMHMTAAGGMLGLLFALMHRYEVYNIGFMIIGFLLWGLIGSSRLYLEAHKPAEVYAGSFVGFITVFLIIVLY